MAKRIPPSELKDVATEESSATDAPKTDKAERLSSMALRKDGTVDVESMRDSTRDKLRTVLPRLAADLGVGKAPESAPATMDYSFISHAAVKLLGTLNGILLIKGFGAPRDLARQIGEYTKQERDDITPSLNLMLEKHLGTMLDKYGVETAFLMTLYAITDRKIALCCDQMERSTIERPNPKPIVVEPPKPGPVDTLRIQDAGESIQ